MDDYHAIELIKFLQTSSDVSSDDLFRIEWAYLPLLERHRDVAPKLLESRLATRPEFFCEVIGLIYRSKKGGDQHREVTENAQAIAVNAWRLLREWRTPPGTLDDGGFDGKKLVDWLKRVDEVSEQTGHLAVAHIQVGEVLIHSPADPDGLWIHRSVAQVLNAREATEMRDGYRTAIYNSRGAHWVDPTGAPERALAEQFRKKAEDVENAGYQRFAQTLRQLADGYEEEAQRVVDDHKREGEL